MTLQLISTYFEDFIVCLASEQVENQPSVASTTETNVMDNDVAETSPTENVLHNQTNEEQSVRYHIPVCPNGLNSMQYADGRPVMCLPGFYHAYHIEIRDTDSHIN